MTTTPGEVYLIDLGMIGKRRPAVVVSRRDPDAPRDLTLLAPMTTKPRGGRYEVEFEKPRWLPLPSVVDIQGLRALSTHDLGHKLGTLGLPTMERIRAALRYALDLE
jgi:mRNA interferase MazF